MIYRVRLRAEAEADLAAIYAYVREHASPAVARAYVGRITDFLAGFGTFPKRGTRRDDIRPGLRIVGFERRVSIAFLVEESEVVILNILYGGRPLPDADPGNAPR